MSNTLFSKQYTENPSMTYFHNGAESNKIGNHDNVELLVSMEVLQGFSKSL